MQYIKSTSRNIALAILLTSCSVKRPKNIILMIGDGMGVTQVTAGYYANGKKLNLENSCFY